MTLELVITAVGPDRPGIASEFSGEILKAGANLADARMVNLHGQFALLALVQGSATTLATVRERLGAAASRIGLRIDISPLDASTKHPVVAGVPYRLRTYSMDQPGIVHTMTSSLRDRGINIEELETRLESAPFMGTPVFTLSARISVPPEVSVKALRRSLEELGEGLNCDVDLERV